MKSQAENVKSLIDIEVSNSVFSSFDKAKDFFTQATDNLQATTQQAKVSLAETVVDAANSITTTGKAVEMTAITQVGKDYLTTATQNAVDTLTQVTSNSINTITATTEQTKGSLEQMLQATGQIKNTTTEAIQTAINSSLNEWLQAHPVVLRLLQMLVWAADRPILSLVILFFAVAMIWSLIKLISRLFERVWLSILQAPFKLGLVLTQAGARSLGRFGNLTIQHLVDAKNVETPVFQSSSSESNQTNKQQRLLEISLRLEALRKEQNELLREAMAIL